MDARALLAEVMEEDLDLCLGQESKKNGEEERRGAGGKKRPVWEDEEEATALVNINAVSRLRKLRAVEEETVLSGSTYAARLRAQHEKLNPGTKWAELPWERRARRKGEGDEYDSEEDSDEFEAAVDDNVGPSTLLEHNKHVIKSKSRLPQGLIEITRMSDANIVEPSEAVIQSVEFHRNAQLLMTAGRDKKLRFFQIDGKRNPKVQSIMLQDFPVHKAAFVPDGSSVVAAGRRNHFFVYELEAGRVEMVKCLIGRDEKSLESFEVSPDSKVVAFLGNEGYIILTSLHTRQCIGTLKMNGSVRSVSFASDGQELLSIGGDGEVYHWDLRSRRCFHKGQDEGCIKSTALEVSSDSRLFATGSGSGVVNLYERESFLGGVTKPLKAFMNLTTNVDNLRFSPDSQILAISSRMKKDALRLVHLPSKTVFSNWPSPKTPLQYVHSMAFSPGGGFFAVGNAAGRVLLYRLHHYDHA